MANNFERNSVIVAGSAFVLGVAVGMLLKDGARQVFERARPNKWHRDFERTEEYDEHLPDQLGRREPAPEPGTPRYGGTGALGVHPAAATTERSEK